MAGDASYSPLRLALPIRCIVKLGGSAITHKNDLECIDDENVGLVASHLREAIMSSSKWTHTMDWSKQLGSPPTIPEVFGDQPLDPDAFIVVHGAAAFNAHRIVWALPSKYSRGSQRITLHKPFVTAGFVATRISVTSLNLEIVRALAKEGIPSVGISPFSCGWSTRDKNLQHASLSPVIDAIGSGFIPVLHGDAVLDITQGCTILSGDVIVRHLAEELRPQHVVFLTDVFGVYDRSPADTNAILLRERVVNEDGSWHVEKPRLDHIKCQVECTVASHDTIGGMMTKITEAATIAKLGITVYIVKVGSCHSVKALKGEVDLSEEEWVGTVIRSSKQIY